MDGTSPVSLQFDWVSRGPLWVSWTSSETHLGVLARNVELVSSSCLFLACCPKVCAVKINAKNLILNLTWVADSVFGPEVVKGFDPSNMCQT